MIGLSVLGQNSVTSRLTVYNLVKRDERNNPNTLSGGVVAGIIILCVIVTMLLAISGFFAVSRRNVRPPRRLHDDAMNLTSRGPPDTFHGAEANEVQVHKPVTGSQSASILQGEDNQMSNSGGKDPGNSIESGTNIHMKPPMPPPNPMRLKSEPQRQSQISAVWRSLAHQHWAVELPAELPAHMNVPRSPRASRLMSEEINRLSIESLLALIEPAAYVKRTGRKALP